MTCSVNSVDPDGLSRRSIHEGILHTDPFITPEPLMDPASFLLDVRSTGAYILEQRDTSLRPLIPRTRQATMSSTVHTRTKTLNDGTVIPLLAFGTGESTLSLKCYRF